MGISRRKFIEAAALASLARPAIPAEAGRNKGILMRVLGRTGAKVTILVFGAGSRFQQYREEDRALEALTLALDAGVNYIDTAISYGNGLSETRVGKLMAARRKDVFLATKMNKRKADEVMRAFDESLKRLQTDHVDLLHIHSLEDVNDLAAIEAKGGTLEAMYKIRSQKMARFIGVTCHTDPMVLKTALERHDFDCTQMALNAARAGMISPSGGFGMSHPMKDSFETVALPVANRKNLGVIAMKVFAQEGLVGAASPDQLLGYSWSLPVTACVVGMPQIVHIRENIQLAKGYEPMAPEKMKQLSDRLAEAKKASLDRFFARHVDA